MVTRGDQATGGSTRPSTAAWIPWLIVLLFAAVGYTSVRAPTPPGDDAPSTDFSTDRALIHIRTIARQPHPMGSAEIVEVRTYLAQELRRLGLEPELQSISAPDYYSDGPPVEVVNIAATIPGTASTGAVALMAHYDTVPATAGANDNSAGVATVLEAGRALLRRTAFAQRRPPPAHRRGGAGPPVRLHRLRRREPRRRRDRPDRELRGKWRFGGLDPGRDQRTPVMVGRQLRRSRGRPDRLFVHHRDRLPDRGGRHRFRRVPQRRRPRPPLRLPPWLADLSHRRRRRGLGESGLGAPPRHERPGRRPPLRRARPVSNSRRGRLGVLHHRPAVGPVSGGGLDGAGSIGRRPVPRGETSSPGRTGRSDPDRSGRLGSSHAHRSDRHGRRHRGLGADHLGSIHPVGFGELPAPARSSSLSALRPH